MDKELILSQSLDGRVIDVLGRGEESVKIQVRVPFEHQIHLDYFLEQLEKGKVILDLRSRTARLGFDIRLDGNGNDAFTRDGSSLVYDASVFPYMQEFLPTNGDWRDVVAYFDWNVGKLIAFNQDRVVTAAEIREKQRERKIRFTEGSSVSDECIQIALDGHVFEPKGEYLKVSRIKDILSDRPSIHRNKLMKLQKLSEEAGDVVVPINGGVVAHTSVRIDGYSMLMQHDQDEGVRLTQALHVSPHSGPDLSVGIKGNGLEDKLVTTIKANLYHDEMEQIKSQIVVPELKLEHGRIVFEESRPTIGVYKHLPGMRGDSGKIVKVTDVIPGDRTSLAFFGSRLHDHVKHNVGLPLNLYFHTFPDVDILRSIQYPEYDRIIHSLSFCKPPVGGETFSRRDYDRLLDIVDSGKEVVWDHPFMGRLYFHKIAFMPLIDIPGYNELYSSNNVFAAFGSASKCTDTDKEDIHSAVHSIARYTGGAALILNGGGPHMMHEFSAAAKKYNLRAGIVTLAIAQEPQQTENMNLIMPFSEDDINTRQELMVESANGGYLVFEGGTGTLFEMFEVITKNYIDMRNRPVFVIGDGEFLRTAYSLLAFGVKTEKINSSVLKTTYAVQGGENLYDAFLSHYNFQKDNPLRMFNQ